MLVFLRCGSVVDYPFYLQFKRLIHGDNRGEISIAERFCSGSLAGATAQTIIYPMEVRYRYRGDKYCGEVLFWLPGWGHSSDYHLPHGGKI